MFTGIITSIGIIDSVETQGDLRLKIACDYKADALSPGASVAVSGCCLTVIAKGFLASGKTYFTVSVSQETVSRTVPGRWEKGVRVNLEQSLKLSDTLDGHLVSGHVDGLATIRAITPAGDSHILEIELPENLMRFMAEKGSVSIDGVSLTINQVKDSHIWVNIIPHTWAHTTLSDRQAGDRVNIEIDTIARYIDRLLTERR